MIAPLRHSDEDTQATAEPVGMQCARRLIAAVLFSKHNQQPQAPVVPKWQAWLLVGWMAASATFYLARMLAALR